MNKLKKNFIYLSLYKILEILLPMITSPLLSRRLGAEALGIYSYTYSAASIFGIIAQLGVYNYGMREIAKVRDSKEKLNEVYSEILVTHCFLGMIIFLIYLFNVFIIFDNYKLIFFIQTFVLLSNVFDNAFLYIGTENIKILSIRDASIKISTFILVLFFVRSPNDLCLYTIIMSLSAFICRIIALIYAKKIAYFVKPNLKMCKRHIKPMFILMIPNLATTIYQSMDKIMIGHYYSEEYVGYYECASKALIPKNFITALGTVMCPHITNLYEKGKNTEIKIKVEKSLIISLIVSYICAFGITSISSDFAPWFWGNNFSICANMIKWLSFSIPIWCVGEVIRNQFLLPTGQDNQYMIAFVLGVLTNGIINYILIPKFMVLGAIIATIIAEFTMSICQFFFVRKKINVIGCILKTLPYLIISGLMFVLIYWISLNLEIKIWLKLIIEISCGAIFYLVLTYLYEKISNKKIILDFLEDIKKGEKK